MSDEINWQKVATAVALMWRISVISGGPGTGRTTIVAKLLAALIQMADGERCRIHLAAPTGKAAVRLIESLGETLRQLPLTDEQKKRIPEDASTLHRLLGTQLGSQRLRHHAGNPLHLDVLVVDEASMIDLPMISRLIDALPNHARVIFPGDRDQLAPAEAGAVLGDIRAYANAGSTAERAGQLSRLTGTHVPAGTGTDAASLRDSPRLLQKSYRFGSDFSIGQLTAVISRGDKTAVKTVFQQDFTDIEKWLLQSGEDYIAMLEEALAGYGCYLGLLQACAEPDLIIQVFNEYQLLCALREGPFGVAGLNERIEQLMQQKRKTHRHPHSCWYEGRPVMIARNDSALGLFNGDIGIALDRGQGMRIWFAVSDGSIKSVQSSRPPEHETTWVMTVHKPQGSEFDHVVLILPSQRTPVVTRELVYIVVIRARRRLSLYADERILSAVTVTRTEWYSGLVALFSSRE